MSKQKIIDFNTMEDMTKDEYKDFVQGENITAVNSEGTLWSSVGHYPVATNAEQLSTYIDQLKADLLEMQRIEGQR